MSDQFLEMDVRHTVALTSRFVSMKAYRRMPCQFSKQSSTWVICSVLRIAMRRRKNLVAEIAHLEQETRPPSSLAAEQRLQRVILEWLWCAGSHQSKPGPRLHTEC